jgi:hypothetical protein
MPPWHEFVCFFTKTLIMDKSKFGNNQEQHLDEQYHNGQSDAEQLMHRHLHADEDALSEETLRNIKVDTHATAPHPAPESRSSDKNDDLDEDDTTGPDRIITPLDVLGG